MRRCSTRLACLWFPRWSILMSPPFLILPCSLGTLTIVLRKHRFDLGSLPTLSLIADCCAMLQMPSLLCYAYIDWELLALGACRIGVVGNALQASLRSIFRHGGAESLDGGIAYSHGCKPIAIGALEVPQAFWPGKTCLSQSLTIRISCPICSACRHH